MIIPPKRPSSQAGLSILSIVVAAALAGLLGWLALQYTVSLARAFEVIADIVGWILLPFRI